MHHLRALILALVLVGWAGVAMAKDGDSGGGGSGSSNSGSGSSSSSGGSSNSGGDDSDDGDDDSDDGDNDHGSGSSGSSGRDFSSRDALDAYSKGKIASFKKIARVATAHTPGRIVDVRLRERSGTYVYRVKILTETGRKRDLQIDATSLKILKVN